MTFAHPYLLLLLLLLPALAWLKGRRGRNSAFLYSSVGLVRQIAGASRARPGAVLVALRWIALGLFIIALAQPRLIKGDAPIKASGIDIVVAIDLSGSMQAEDFEMAGEPVNRLDIAKNVLAKFIENRPNDRIGLVAFAGRAYIASPLTLDHDFLHQNLSRLRLGLIEDSTAIGSALMASLNRLRDLKSKSRIVILMTDGQNNAGKVPPMAAAEVGKTLGVRVYTIGVGTRGQARVPVQDIFGNKSYALQNVDIDEETLTKIADMTGGKYFRADNTETLRRIYSEIDRMEKTEASVKKFQRFDELYGPVVLAGFCLLMLEMILGQTIWRKLP